MKFLSFERFIRSSSAGSLQDFLHPSNNLIASTTPSHATSGKEVLTCTGSLRLLVSGTSSALVTAAAVAFRFATISPNTELRRQSHEALENLLLSLPKLLHRRCCHSRAHFQPSVNAPAANEGRVGITRFGILMGRFATPSI